MKPKRRNKVVVFFVSLTSWTVYKPLVFGGTSEERSSQLPHTSAENSEENKRGKETTPTPLSIQYEKLQCVSVQHSFSFFSCLLQVLEQCRYEQVVPLTLLFSSTLLKVSHFNL